MKPLLLFVGLVWVIALAGFAAAGPEPLVQPGQVYLLIESCVGITLGGKCNAEIHKIVKVLPDQWVETRQCENDACTKTGGAYRINLAHVYAIQPHRASGAQDAF